MHTSRSICATLRSMPAVALLVALSGSPLSARAADAESPTVEALIAELGLREGATPVRERPRWRPPKKIVFLAARGLPDAQRTALASAAPDAELIVVPDVAAAAKAAADADVIAGLTSFPGICEPEIIDNARELRWILSMSAGVERCVTVPSVHERNILITNLRAVESASIGEHSIALVLALGRRLDKFVANQSSGRWSRADAAGMQVMREKTMLVVGLGGIGTEVASRAHALGMKVVATRASGRRGPDFVDYVGLPDEMLTLAKDADVVVNTAPLTSETTGIFDAQFFATLKSSALFINVARGGSVVTDDLVDALERGIIAGAGLDVVDPEPLPADHPLWRAPNVIITPHISSASDLPREQRWLVAQEKVRRYVAGEKMLSVVDLDREY